jgi:hypothetical protein
VCVWLFADSNCGGLVLSKINSIDVTNFRNNIIHQGYFPTRDKAYAYGRFVFDTILSIYRELLSNNAAYVEELLDRELAERRSKSAQDILWSSLEFETMLSLKPGDNKEYTFDEELKKAEVLNRVISRLKSSSDDSAD